MSVNVLMVHQLLVLLLGAVMSDQDFKFSVWSERNASGHLEVKMMLEHSLEGGNEHSTGDWNVQLEHKKVKRENGEAFEIFATIVAPSSGPSGSSGTSNTSGPSGSSRPSVTSNISGPSGSFSPSVTSNISGPSRLPERLGYTRIEGAGCFKLFPKAKTWEEADATCTNDKAFLTIINAKTEAKVLDKLIYKAGKVEGATCYEYFFIGANDKKTTGKFYTVLGKPLEELEYVNWAPGQPDNNTAENCVAYYVKRGMHDVPCSWKLGFICEAESC